MKKFLFAVLASSIAVPAYAAPGDSSTAQGTATAQIVAPITLTHVSGAALSFGTLTAGTGGTATVSVGSVRTVGGDVSGITGVAPAADAFTVTGDANRSFSITTAGGTVANGGNSMAFTTTAAATGALSASGTASFRVGGTLTVGNNQAPGSYTGTYNATVSYN
ncbi:DUF4402 domain-containing protein [Porphyrobacter sp. GA68]|uniref:DUF4402 domain-containing protein n=1 Tax=Porphyrobacter sp. GA68 TaxID=2883480 RepID=UPI001D18E8E5|nr:DUF4402 domain-containing protein [Porphyrobacter sp. GA68]